MDEAQKLAAVFKKYDTDGSGSVSQRELSSALADMGSAQTPAGLDGLMAQIDTDSSGELDFSEFKQLFGEARLRKVFLEMDTDGSGHISAAELDGALLQLGHRLSALQIRRILAKVDVDQSGEVSFKEFREFFKFVPAASLAAVAQQWMSGTAIDCGSDLAPPISSPDVPWYYAVCGGIGGCVSRTLTAPLEKVKLVAQTSGRPVAVLRELRRTYAQHGARGLFAGNGTNCLRVFPYAGIVTWCYLSGLQLTPADSDFDAWEPVYRGSVAAAAGVVGQLLTYPIDVVRARMTVNAGAHTGVASCARSIYREAGARGLYRGLGPTLATVAPFVACQMATADAGKALAAERGVEVTAPVMMLVGGAAGIAAQTLVYPLDVLRRRLQVQGAQGAQGAQAAQAVVGDSAWTALQQVVRREGVRSLFAGIVPTYAKVLPAVAIAMTTTKACIGLANAQFADAA
jgi:solute carrier family 25 phosphate transporter 23/24/25/41